MDAALAWPFGSETGFSFHSDYLWHRANLFQVDGRGIHAYYGVGGRLININNRNEYKTRLGLRLPAGLNFDVNRSTLQLFAAVWRDRADHELATQYIDGCRLWHWRASLFLIRRLER